MVDPPGYCHLFTPHHFCFHLAPQKIQLASHIHSLAELLHANAMQQLELALLGSPAAKVLDVLAMAT